MWYDSENTVIVYIVPIHLCTVIVWDFHCGITPDMKLLSANPAPVSIRQTPHLMNMRRFVITQLNAQNQYVINRLNKYISRLYVTEYIRNVPSRS